MTRTDLVGVIVAVVLALSSAMGWDQAFTNDKQRLVAIETMAQALAACERRQHEHP